MPIPDKLCQLCEYPMENRRRTRHPICQREYRLVYEKMYNVYVRTAQQEARDVTKEEFEVIHEVATEGALESYYVQGLIEEYKEKERKERAAAITKAASEDVIP